MDANIRLDHSLVALETEQDVHAMLELVAPEPDGHDDAPPLRLALVIDRSGSMAGAKLDVAKRCGAWLVSRLREPDQVALVDYDDHVRLLAPLGAPHDHVAHALGQVHAGGSTNLSGGWLKGVEQLRAADNGAPRKVLLLTDGLANVGITDRDTLVGLAQRNAQAGIGTTTIGFGHGFDEDLLTQMADAGGGNAHYAETPDAAPAIFAQELEGLTQLTAQNVSVEIRPRPDVDFLGVLNDYPCVPVAGGLQMQLGDAYAGDRRRIVLALHVPRLAELGVETIAELVVRYVSVGAEVAEHVLTLPIVVNAVSAQEAAAAGPDAEVHEEVLVLKAARARDEAIRLADSGDVHAAQSALRFAAQSVAMSPVATARLGAEAEELEQAALTLDGYSVAARKQLRYASTMRRRKRR
jgi:Ca-activated chloride channel family protein